MRAFARITFGPMKESFMTDKISRRAVLLRGLQVPVAGAVLFGLASCGAKGEHSSTTAGGTVCADPNAMTDSELSTRKGLDYTEASPNPKTVCGGCAFFHAAATGGGGCGTCDVLSGAAANSKGHCNSWSAKA
jgi:hypothetical protein